jgi:hypothetical protein
LAIWIVMGRFLMRVSGEFITGKTVPNFGGFGNGEREG